jgi:hypothetical protein
MPHQSGPDDANAAVFADAGTSRAVIDVTKHQGLASLSGFPFEVRTSASTREQARRLADRCGRAYSYLGEMLAFRPRCALLVLNRADWSERASNPSYVMPYYDAGNLFLTGEPSDLTAWLEEVASSAPPAAAQELDQVYGTGADRLMPFADMLIVHELAHAFHDGVSFVFPRSWLMELFADMALYAFVVAEEPERRLHFETLRRLWDAFALSDEQLASVLGGRVHPEAGYWLASWDELTR